MRLEHLPLGVEARDLLFELGANVVHGSLDRRRRRHVLSRRPDDEVVERPVHLAGERIEMRDRLHVVAEERDAIRRLRVGRLDLHDVALDAKAAAAEHGVVAHVLARDQLAQSRVTVVRLPRLEDRARARATLPVRRSRRCRRPMRRSTTSRRVMSADVAASRSRRCRRSARSSSRCRGQPGGRMPRAGSSRSTRRSIRRRSPGRTRGTRCRAGPRASCCGR